jgi:zinc protease
VHEGRGDQAAVVSIWPGPGRFPDVRQEKAVEVLSEIIQLRLMDEVREAQGGTYTPFGNAYASGAQDGFGYIFAGVEPKPEAADLFFETMGAIARELRDGEVSKDLLDRARKPLLYQLHAAQTTNEYWIEALRDAQRDPRMLERARNEVDEIAAVTAADVQKAAQRYLDDRRRIDIRVLPRK